MEDEEACAEYQKFIFILSPQHLIHVWGCPVISCASSTPRGPDVPVQRAKCWSTAPAPMPSSQVGPFCHRLAFHLPLSRGRMRHLHKKGTCWSFDTTDYIKDVWRRLCGCEGELCRPPCENGGRCLANEKGDWRCYCWPDFSGERCEVNHCTDYCLNGGTCMGSPLGKSTSNTPVNYTTSQRDQTYEWTQMELSVWQKNSLFALVDSSK